MRYDDASSTFGQAAAGTPDARDDADALAAGSSGPATGNTITGTGTITGTAGADIVSNGPGTIVALEGAGGTDTADGGSLKVAGRFGEITMDSRGNYRYEPNDDSPNGGLDVFRYTLADSAGARDTANLTIEIGREIEEIKADAQQIVPGPDGVVTLPPGVQLSDVHVVGRNLVINLPDGTQMVIIDGAVFVPQLVLGGVEVPASNLAALLIDAEPKPAAGTPLSSGGNFAVDVPPLDPGVPLGDLIPPTELTYNPPEFQDVGQFIDEEPEIFIQPDGQPASVAAVDSVDEAGLPERDGNLPDEPAGSGESADGNGADNDDSSETTTGVILVDSPDDPSVVRINGEVVTGVIGQQIEGAHGILTITSFSDTQIGYSYTLTDNTAGDATHDDFSVSVTDNDGDVATATLTINIIDDEPTARNDTDASVNGTATGNVMTDAAPGDVGDTDTNAADTVGADNATLTSVSGAGGTDSTFSEGVLTVNGNFGTLVIDAAGNYTYTVNPNAGGGGVDVFTYTLTDGDGDTSSATLTITNPDLSPNLPNPDAVLLDDDALTDGNAGGDGDDPDSQGLPGQLAGTGGDGDLDYAFTGVNTLPAGFTANPVSASVLQILQGATVVLTITLDTETGAFNVVQNNPIDHPVSSTTEDNLVFSIGVEVEDVDGDVEPATITINVDDDTPTISREDVSPPTLTVDETDLATNATGDFSTLFEVNYGADGAGTTSYAVSVVNGTDSGLVDVATGQSIFLFNNAGVVEGRVGGVGGAVAFTVSVNTSTGVVTLDQIRALDHPINPNPDDSVSPDPTSIQFTVNAVDGDGDPVSETINIGGNLVFDDDGPSVDPEVDAEATVTVDESLPSTAPAIDTGLIVKGDDPDLAGGLALGQANSGVAIVDANAVFGADGPAAAGSITYALSITSVDPGVTLTDGTPIELQLVNGVIVGVVDGGTFDGQAAFAIAIDPATGVVSVEQYLSLDHPVNPDPNDPLGLGDNTVAVVVTATDGDGDPVESDAIDISGQITFLDDGPSVDPELDAEATVTVDESLPSTAPAINTGAIVKGDDPDLAGGLALGQANSGVAIVDANAVFGADGPAAGGGITYSLSITNAASGVTLTDGTAINLQMVGGVIVGVVAAGTFAGQAAFAIAINSTTGVVSVEQYLSLDHPVNPDPNDPLGLGDNTVAVTVTATDGDGDPVTSDAVDISGQITFLDDGPDADPVLEENSTVTVDESLPSAAAAIDTLAVVKGDDPDLAGGLAIGSGNSGAAVIDVNAVFGADGPAAGGGVTYALSVLNASSGLTLTDGSAINLQLLANGVVVGVVAAGAFAGQAAFAIAINPATGVVTVEQYLSLDHPDTNDHNDPLGLGEATLGVTATVTDGDGDSITSDAVDISGQITFLDDGPNAQVDGQASLDTLVLDETTPPGTETDGDSNPAGLVQTTANFADNFVAPVNYGADGPGTTTYSLVLSGDDVPSGLYAIDPSDISAGDGDGYGRGAQIVLNQTGNTITGSAGGVDYFTISINPATGVVTFTQLDNIWHANTASDDDTSTLMADLGSLLVRQTVTDGDGDTDTADVDISQGVFQIEDDGPVANNDVDEIAGGGSSASGNVITGVGTNAGAPNADDVGADTPGRVTAISGFGGSDSSFSAGVLEVDGEFGSLEIDANGNYTYTRFDGAPGDAQDVFTYTLTDADGDSTTATLTINIGDAAPNLPDPALVRLDDDVIPGADGNLDGPGDDDPDAVPGNVVNGQLAGTGGDGTLTYNFTGTNTLPTGFSIGAGSDVDTLIIVQDQGGSDVPVMTIELDQSDGSFTVTQNAPILHDPNNPGAGAGQEDNYEDNLTFSIGVEVEDADGDVEPATITINVDDDTPVLSNVQAGDDVTLDETSAGTPAGFPINATSDTAVITATQAFGADGAAAANSVVYGLSIVGGSPEPSGLSTAVGNFAITLVQIDADTIEGQYQDGGTQLAFTIQMNADGTVTLTQEVPLEHNTDGGPGPAHNDALDLTGLINATVTITDGDGDSATASAPIGDNLVFLDDGPDAQLSGTAVGTVTLDETRPEGDDRAGAAPNGTDSEQINFAANFVTGGSVDYGADGGAASNPVTYALVLTGTNVASGLYAIQGTDTSLAGVDGDGYGQGDQIVLNQSGNTITGSVGGTDYFTITIDPATGITTFTQLNNIWHPTPGTSSFDEAATLTTLAASAIKVVQTVTDSDGDTDTAEINVGQGVFIIQDDGPQAIQPDEATVTNTADEEHLNVPLDDDGSLTGDFGTDLPGKITFANITPGGMATTEEANGETIELWLSADGQTLEGRTLSTDGTDGNLIYTVQINGNGTYSFTLNDEIDNGSGTEFANLSGGVAGNPPFKLIQSSTADTLELLATPINGTSINSDTDDMGVDSQFVDTSDGTDDKGVRLDFGDFTYVVNDGGTADDAFIMVNHSTVNGFRFAIDQVSNGTTADVRLRALDADEDGGVEEQAPDPAGDVTDPITMVKIYSVAEVAGEIVYTLVGTFVADGAIGATGATIDFEVGGTVLIDDLPAGYAIQTYTADGYERIEITNPGNNDSGDTDGKYSLSLFSIETTDQGDPVDLFFDIAITDADGDSIVLDDAIHVNVDPAGSSSLTSLSSAVVSQESFEDTSSLSLLSSDSLDQQRTMSAANNNSVLLGAIAAAGLASGSLAAARDFAPGNLHRDGDSIGAGDGGGLVQGALAGGNSNARSALAGETQEAVEEQSSSSSSAGNSDGGDNSLTDGGGDEAQAPTELLEGTEAPQSAPAESSFTSDAVAMPSAEMLAAANENAVDSEAKGTGEVGRALADALAGGGGPDIDALLDAVANQGSGANAAIEALASQGAGAVPGWDMAAFGGFNGGHLTITMETLVLHHDAVPTAA